MSEQQSSLVAKRVESTAPDPVAGQAEGVAAGVQPHQARLKLLELGAHRDTPSSARGW